MVLNRRNEQKQAPATERHELRSRLFPDEGRGAMISQHLSGQWYSPSATIAPLSDECEIANRRVSEAREFIAQQRIFIDQIAGGGRSTGSAERMLAVMVDIFRQLK